MILFNLSIVNIMQKILTAVLFLFFASSFISAQTANTNPAQNAPPVNYSESMSYQPREFPIKKNSKPKKEKKSKKNEPAADETQVAADLPAKTEETITIPVSVFDANGKFVGNLKQSDFKIFADGKEQEILSAGRRDEPVNVILLIDTSPSTAYKIEEIQNYALAIVERLKPDDKVMVIGVDAETKMLTEPTSDRQIISKAIRKVKFGDGTSLYEAVKNTLVKYASRISGRTAIVLLTDGVDTTSLKSNYADSLLAAEKTDTAVFPIYFDTFGDDPKAAKINKIILPGILGGSIISGLPGGTTQGATAVEYEIGRMYLNDISILSGGRPHAVKNIADSRAENVDNVGGELRAQYQIIFRPSDFTAGQRKRITVRVNHPNLYVQARGSYIAANN